MQQKVIFINIPHPVLQQGLEENGFICDLEPEKSKEEIEAIIGDYFGLVIHSRFPIDRRFIDKAVNLRFIARVGSGMESIDCAYAESKGILCLNSPEGNRDAVGEHTLGLLLALMNKITIADREVRKGFWKREENRGTEIKGKTVGIIGYGNTGSAFAQRLKGFEVRLLAYDKYKSGFSNDYVEECAPEAIFEHADILSLHIPLTSETRYLVNDDFIGRFHKPFWLLNTSRGKIVDTEALVRALKTRKILGAGLDVLEYEDISFEKMNYRQYPEPLKYLVKSGKVVLTPHIAGWTTESKIRLAEVLLHKILAAFR